MRAQSTGIDSEIFSRFILWPDYEYAECNPSFSISAPIYQTTLAYIEAGSIINAANLIKAWFYLIPPRKVCKLHLVGLKLERTLSFMFEDGSNI